jgi:3-hydroxyisobutyrate dehydrogenase-like beta-hydroxyacid dehydrogenase
MRLALAGLGNMGGAIGERLLDAGYPLTVWNRSPEKTVALSERGATRAERPEDLLGDCADILLTMLADDDALRAVAVPALQGARRGTILIDLSTVSPEASTEIAALAESGGVAFLRAPVSGNPTVVRGGTLTLIVSGPDEAYEQAKPVLEAIGPTVYHVGDGEQARVVKLALQIMVAGTAELMSEALALATAGDVEARTLLEVMANSAVGSPLVRYKTEPLLAGDYSATFTTQMMKKDLDLVEEFARERGVPLPLVDTLGTALDDTIAAGHADRDFMALYLRLSPGARSS